MITLLRKRYLYALIILDLVMFFTALTVDFRDFTEVPLWRAPFTPICSIYPLLIALNYIHYVRRGFLPPRLAVFTSMGIVGYGLMALFFYPSYMLEQGFGWYELGNVFWVLAYSSQIMLLVPTKAVSSFWILLFGSYFLTKDFLDRYSDTFSYVRYGMMSENLADALFALIVGIHTAIIIVMILVHRKEPARTAARPALENLSLEPAVYTK